MRRPLTTMLLAGAVLAPAGLEAQQALTPGPVQSGTLSFDARATAGDFVGTTQAVEGEMTGGPDLAGVRGWVQAPVNTLKTGNGRRDRDLLKSMEADKFPVMRFSLTGVTPGVSRNDTTAVMLSGEMLLHGVARQVEFPGIAIFQPGSVRVRADFPLDLRDYNIGGLSRFLGLFKMHPDIIVHVDVTFRQGQA